MLRIGVYGSGRSGAVAEIIQKIEILKPEMAEMSKQVEDLGEVVEKRSPGSNERKLL